MNSIGMIMDYIKATKYNIGFVDVSLEAVIAGEPMKVNWMKHTYKDRWFADPFILDVTDGEIIVLVEEWFDPISRGRISKLIIDKYSYELKDLKVMIDEGFHMSFPAITRKKDGIYIQPECGLTRGLMEYKYDVKNDKFDKVRMISDLPLADSVRNDIFEEDLMFSTKLPDANGKELGIYTWDETSQKYMIKDYYYFEENISRMAGNFFVCNNKIFRPAQVCIKSYGDAVSLQEVSNKNGKWKFKEIRRIYSPNKDFDLGFHTFNEYKGVVVVDGLGYRRPRLGRLLRGIKNMVKNQRFV